VFVSRPYQERKEQRHEDTILPAIKTAGLRAVRSDHGLESGPATQEMPAELRNAAVCALLTDLRYVRSPTIWKPYPSVNPNVMYEIGYAHALGRRPSSWPTAPTPFRSTWRPAGPASAAACLKLAGMLRSARHKLDTTKVDSLYETTARP
jgi:hypothetical protein